jgi:hypothetical protein
MVPTSYMIIPSRMTKSRSGKAAKATLAALSILSTWKRRRFECRRCFLFNIGSMFLNTEQKLLFIACPIPNICQFKTDSSPNIIILPFLF